MTTLTDVRRVQPGWFSPVSKRYFGDIKYLVLRGKVSGDLFLLLHVCSQYFAANLYWTDLPPIDYTTF